MTEREMEMFGLVMRDAEKVARKAIEQAGASADPLQALRAAFRSIVANPDDAIADAAAYTLGVHTALDAVREGFSIVAEEIGIDFQPDDA